MTAITVKRTIIRRAHVQPSETRRTFRELARPYLAGERTIKFAIKLLLFAIIVAISAFAAAGALAEFLHQAQV
jgi:hypothetical protein